MDERDSRLDAYLQREKTLLGRMANIAIDTARDLTGRPSRWTQALAYEQRQAQPDPLTGFHYIAANDSKPPGWRAGVTMLRDFSDMIMTSLEASGLTPKDQLLAMSVIDNASVYLHGADPTNRLARTALPGSISAEWNQLGITEEQANEMINKAIGYIQEQRQSPGRVADRLAAEMTQQEAPEPDWAALSEKQVREAFEHRDTSNDYAEAYADVAGYPTLSWRLEDESPIDILADVKRQVHGEAFGPAPDTTTGLHYIGRDDPKPLGWCFGAERDDVERFISVLTHRLKQEGYTVREVSPEQDNELDLGH